MVDVADSNAVYYYHFDGLGSVVALSDVNNVVVESYSYDVFGAPTIYDANYTEISPSAVGNPYMFTARRADDETALYYYRARYYAFDIGRFLQTDPIGYADGLNLYAYVRNNPITFLDPLGLKLNVTGDRVAVDKALDYLANAGDAYKTYIEYIRKTDEVTFNIITNRRDTQDATKFQSDIWSDADSAGRIHWNPYLGGLSIDGELSTPALALGHELGHYNDWLLNRPNPPQKDEAYIISKWETPMAEALGEHVRTSHVGTFVAVKGPLSTEWDEVRFFEMFPFLKFLKNPKK